MPEKDMPRKILKILISLLFLVVAAVAAVFAIKIFTPKPTSEPVQPNHEIDWSTATRYGIVGVSQWQELKAIKSKSDLRKQQETK